MKHLFMVIERYRNDDPVPVYRRFQAQGRILPEGLKFISSWVKEDLTCCFQVMETEDTRLMDQWIEEWKDIVDFEIVKVITSERAMDRIEFSRWLDQGS
jgi:hypothetical protein